MDRANGPTRSAVAVLRWIARIWSVAAILVLSAFFIEHLSWFAGPSRLPPAWVFVAQGCHLLLVVGLAAAWRWEREGAGLALLGAAGFFATLGFDLDVLPFLAAMAFPAVAWIASAWISSRTPQGAAA
jgi:hypothetical protein